MAEMGKTFDNGLTNEQQIEIDDLSFDLNRIKDKIKTLGRHRNYSLALTKLDEAEWWLANRTYQPAQETN